MSKGSAALGRILITAGTFGTAFAQWFVVWLFARSYGPAEVGAYSTLYAIATPVFVGAQFGLRDVYLSLRTRYPDRTYVVMRVAGALLGAALLLAIALGIALPVQLALAMALMKIGESMLDLRYAFSQSRHRMTRLGTLMCAYAAGMIAAVIGVTAVVGHPAPAIAAAGLVGLSIVLADWLIPLAPIPASAASGVAPILRAAAPVTVTQLVFALVASSPVFLLHAAADEASVGVYTGASYLLVFANLVGATLQTIVLPGYRDLAHQGRYAELASSARRLGLRLLGVAAAAGVIAVAFGTEVLRLVYGEQFGMGHDALVPLVIATVVVGPAYLLNALLLVLNAYRDGAIGALLSLIAGIAVGVLALALGIDAIAAASWTALGAVAARVAVSLIQVRRRWSAAASASN